MILIPRLRAVVLLSSLFGLLLASPGAVAYSPGIPDTLADSTVVRNWTLENGLRVVTRHIPDAGGVAVTLAYDIGSADDPPGREGLAQLLCEVVYTAPAGDIPERTREDLASLRPIGWSFIATRRYTMFTEISKTRQFPGVLQQVATRMRGVQVTREGLQLAVGNVREQLNERLDGPPSAMLYPRVRDVSVGYSDEVILRAAQGRGLDKITPAQVQERIQQLYVPANAVLSLAGNFDDLDLGTLVRSLFGSIPAGARIADTAPDTLKAAVRTLQLPQVKGRQGAIGIIAPALDDTSHPAFYLHTMLLTSHLSQVWSKLEDSGPGPFFHYAILDEPDLARLFPPGAATTDDLGTLLDSSIAQLYTTVITRESYQELRSTLAWLLGGPMTRGQLDSARQDSATLHTLARSAAGRQLLGGESFWAAYLQRFVALPAGGLQTWMDHYNAPEHQVLLMVTPAR